VREGNDRDDNGDGEGTGVTTTTMGVAMPTTTTMMWTLICKSPVHFYSLYYIYDVYGSLLSTMPDHMIFNEKKSKTSACFCVKDKLRYFTCKACEIQQFSTLNA
jgi:hypothetical protein